MVTAIVLLKVEQGRVNAVAEELATLEGVSEVYSVSGKVDIVVIARVRTNDELAALVTARLHLVKGVVESQTMLAFRAYSRHDLDAIFSLD